MSSPTCFISSDEEESSCLAELKAVIEAEERLWAEKKACREQERQQQKERERLE